MTIEEAKRRHPAGRARLEYLIEEAQNREAMDVANRVDVEVDAWAGGPMRKVDEKVHEVMTGPHARWLDVAVPFVIAMAIFVVIFGTAFLGELFGGWPV